ncbi:hypothetical protein [Sphaerimonospora thailandensis]|nr:hypothetical protein [Sphaerimonospora thailandensis]
MGGGATWPGAVSGGAGMAPNPAMNQAIHPVVNPAMAMTTGPAMGMVVGGVTGTAMGPIPGHPPALVPAQVQCAVTLQRLYAWLQMSLPQAPQVAGIIPLLVQAVQLYRAGQFEACLAQLQAVLGFVNSGQPTVPLL